MAEKLNAKSDEGSSSDEDVADVWDILDCEAVDSESDFECSDCEFECSDSDSDYSECEMY